MRAGGRRAPETAERPGRRRRGLATWPVTRAIDPAPEATDGSVGRIKRREDPRFITGTAQLPRRHQAARHGARRDPPQPVRARPHPRDRHVARQAMPGVLAVYHRRGPRTTRSDGLAWPAAQRHPVKNNLNTPAARHRGREVGRRGRRGGRRGDAGSRPRRARGDRGRLEPLPAVVDAEKARQPGAPSSTRTPRTTSCSTGRSTGTGRQAAIDSGRGRRPPADRQPAAHPQPDGDRAATSAVQRRHGRVHGLDVSQTPHIQRLLLTAFVMGIPEHKIAGDQPGRRRGRSAPRSPVPRHGARHVRARSNQRAAGQVGREPARELPGDDRTAATTSPTSRWPASATARITGPARQDVGEPRRPSLDDRRRASPRRSTGCVLSGRYRFPNVWCEVTGVYTNTTCSSTRIEAPAGPRRTVVERAMDLFAAEIGLDRGGVRRRNFVPRTVPVPPVRALPRPGTAPRRTSTRATTSPPRPGPGDGRLQGPRRPRPRRCARGKLLGLGLSTYIEICGVAPRSGSAPSARAGAPRCGSRPTSGST